MKEVIIGEGEKKNETQNTKKRKTQATAHIHRIPTKYVPKKQSLEKLYLRGLTKMKKTITIPPPPPPENIFQFAVSLSVYSGC